MAYCLCPQRQTVSTGPRDHFHLLVGRAPALVGVLTAAQAEVFHDSPVVAVLDHSLLVEAIQGPFYCLVANHNDCHSAHRCMRLAGVGCRILLLHLLLHRDHLLRHSGRLDVYRIAGWEQVVEACCSQGAQSLCAVGVRLW